MKKPVFLFLMLFCVLIAAFLFSVFCGSATLEAKEIIQGLFYPDTVSQASIIIWQLRIPRIMLGLLVGAGLACCGVVFQAMLRNSLAEPYTLGISSGAALGAAIGILNNLGGIHIAVFSFLGSLATISLVYFIASKKRFSNTALILSGVVLGFLFSSIVLLILALARQEGIHSGIIWLMGDLSCMRPELLKVVSFFIVGGILTLFIFSRDIDIICLGDQKARHLGLDTSSIKRVLFLASSLIAGACVSSSGIIGFVGLIIPHMARWMFGVKHTRLLVAAALMGAIFLIFCDTLARIIIRPLELPVGVITGIFGGFFFLVLLLRAKKWGIA